MSRPAPVSPEERQRFRRTMSRFATGVAILTAAHEGQRYGMTINSLTSVSLDPFQILVCIAHNSSTGAAIRASGLFAVSLLESQQSGHAANFVGPAAPRFSAVDCASGVLGLPVVRDALASLTCEVSQTVSSGDHDIVIGNVIDCNHREGQPLVFFSGGYGGFAASVA